MSIRQKIKKLLGRTNPEKEAMEYCLKNGFTHGKNFSYNSGYPIDGNFPWLISIGDDVTLASNVRILAHDASTAKAGTSTKIGTVEIGSNVFIGADSIVLCNTKIGDNVIIGAGSVVTRDVPSGTVYAGNPAKFVCSFEEFQKRHFEKRKTAPIFSQRPYYDWKNSTEAERQEMKEKLKGTCGYLWDGVSQL